jgi:hypothetical protein
LLLTQKHNFNFHCDVFQNDGQHCHRFESLFQQFRGT